MSGKKVIIIGAGAQATVIAGVLAEAHDVAEILVTDIDLPRATELAEVNGSPKVRAELLDASDVNGMATRIRAGSFDLVVNATIPMFVHQVMKATVKAGTHYIDMASNEIYPEPGIPVEQFFYADDFEKAGLMALTGAGGDPGLSNIMAKDIINGLDTVDSIMIKDFGEIESDEPVALWSMRTYLEDLYLPPTIWEDGKARKVEPFTGEELYDLPAPFNKTGKFYYHDHEEGVTIPLYAGKPMRYCDFKIGEPGIDMWRFVVQDLDLMNEEPIEIGGGTVTARNILLRKAPTTVSARKQIELYESGKLESRLVLICDGTGEKDGRAVRYHSWTQSPAGSQACKRLPGTNDVSWMTSIPASVFALMVLRGEVHHTGVFPPEVFTPDEIETFYHGIKEWGITVIKRVETAVV